ncbi:MAG: PEP-CTERM sorting domain-containing protein [Alphaproteobacteria bacterium]|jgi:hypothetical protein|nr:PEP-CTERM sorting domain-containing protein [Alphaproteobacteria bacterium]MDP6567472.1 PEP-CTERM sorting domain-containing protein [Alphaproteobacteria bacterium]MDP6815338.1 PEP-CTERM sorting domain-containing protein [Alphaproteobacteria bacterium]
MTTSLKSCLAAAACAGSLLAWGHAGALPIGSAAFENRPTCDTVADQFLKHEIGENVLGHHEFPFDELITVSVTAGGSACHGTGSASHPEYTVAITNATFTETYKDLFFVIDDGPGLAFGNPDGVILTGTGSFDAMAIDDVGENKRTVVSGDGDLLFEPGEIWAFVLVDFIAPTIPIFNSAGFGDGSSGYPPSTASILANRVPEPGALAVLLIGLAGLTAGRRRTSRGS